MERDALPAGLEGRRAVPQGRHAHALLPHGQACLDALLPGFSGELVAAGAPTCAALEEMRVRDRRPSARPRIDWAPARSSPAARSSRATCAAACVRCRSVALIDRCDAARADRGRDGERVTGVRILRRADGSAERDAPADLVVAPPAARPASPPGSRRSATRARARSASTSASRYASRHLWLPADAARRRQVRAHRRPARTSRARCSCLPRRAGAGSLTLGGYGPEHRPPTDPDGLAAFAATVAPPEVAEALRGRRAARRDRHAPLPRQRPPPLRPPARASRPGCWLRRRDLLVQPDLRAGDDRRRRPGGRAARLPRARRARPRAPLLQPPRAPPSITPGSCRSAPTSRCPRSRGRGLRGVRLINAYLRRLRASAPSTTRPSPAPSSPSSACVERPPHVLRPAIAVRVARGPRPSPGATASTGCAAASCASAGSPHRCARPARADAAEAVVFLHGNPGSSADWEPLLAAVGSAPARRAWDAPGFGHAAAPGRVRADRRRATRRSSATRSTRSGSSARTSCCTTSAGPGACAGRPSEPDAVRQRGPARHRRHCPAIAGTRSRALWRTPAARRAAHGRHDPPPASGSCCGAATRGRCRGRSSTACTTTSTAHTRRAVLELYRSVPDVAAAGERLARALRPLDRPALVLWGRHDPYLPVTLAARQRDAFPRAEIRVLERSGHWPFVDDPATVDRGPDRLPRQARRRPHPQSERTFGMRPSSVALFGALALAALLASAGPASAQLDRRPMRSWQFNEVQRGLGTVVADQGSQQGGRLDATSRLRPGVDRLRASPPTAVATGEIFSSANGQRFEVVAESPSHGNEGRNMGGISQLTYLQSFEKRSDEATLQPQSLRGGRQGDRPQRSGAPAQRVPCRPRVPRDHRHRAAHRPRLPRIRPVLTSSGPRASRSSTATKGTGRSSRRRCRAHWSRCGRRSSSTSTRTPTTISPDSMPRRS